MARMRKWSVYVAGEYVESELFPIEMSLEDVLSYFVIDCGYPRSETEVIPTK
jgi:hypothetical protein